MNDLRILWLSSLALINLRRVRQGGRVSFYAIFLNSPAPRLTRPLLARSIVVS
jgi:hypothetical protein